VGLVVLVAVTARGRVREEAAHERAFHHRGIVRVGTDGAVRVRRVRGADHAEERVRLWLAVDHPRRVEDLVAAVLRVRLGEHREFHVCGVPVVTREVRDEVVDLVGREGQSEHHVRFFDRLAAAREHVDGRERPGREVVKELVGFV
jgi:predicted DCC family thiol-disulfide oxidoreductase YuxK